MKRIDATDPTTIRYKFRARRFERVDALIRDVLRSQDQVSILDIGGRRDYWAYLAKDLRPVTTITVVNYEEELVDYPETIEELRIIPVVGDGCSMPEFADQSFDIAHSNSVIEHVGSMVNMFRFAEETRRIGRSYYAQVPYLWFPLEPHFGVPFLHWLPGPTRAQLLHRFKMGYGGKIAKYSRALEVADTHALVDKTLMRKLFPEAEMHRERFALLTKSLIMVKPLDRVAPSDLAKSLDA